MPGWGGAHVVRCQVWDGSVQATAHAVRPDGLETGPALRRPEPPLEHLVEEAHEEGAAGCIDPFGHQIVRDGAQARHRCLDGALRLCVAEPLREVVEVLLARVDEAQHHRVETEGPHLGRAWPALLLGVPVVAQQDVGGARRDEARPLEVGGALGGCSLPRAFAGELLPSPVLVINLPLVEPRWLKAHAAHLALGGAKGLRVLLGAVFVHVGAAARLRAARLEADNTGGFRLSLGHRYADRNALRRCLRGHRRGWWRGRRRGLSCGQLARWFSVGMRDRGAC
mmetsp:Transcript_9496/g.30016  ORF Transcript_9496/g.30016 Transcript_9496/m.30016 type:complete len:282 (-) Transcript_9496:32-877(-)